MAIYNIQQKHDFFNKDCHICGKAFIKGRNIPFTQRRVLDHDHFVCENGKEFGQFRGPAHSICNLKYKLDPKTWKLPVVLHNFVGYDSHLIVKALEEKHGSTRVIPNNMEKYLSLSVGQLRFIDSLQFLNASLDSLVKNLEVNDLKYTKQEFPNSEEFDLIKEKGIFPYDFLDSMNCFNAKELPPRRDFFNKLLNRKCSPLSYFRARMIWSTFNCQTFADYHNIYLKSDVTLLADVFEKFRLSSMNTYNLDPAHYMSLPGLSFDAALRYTGIELELFTDPDMYLFMENSIRGGISMISKRFAQANHKKLKSFDLNKRLQHLVYLDSNNL